MLGIVQQSEQILVPFQERGQNMDLPPNKEDLGAVKTVSFSRRIGAEEDQSGSVIPLNRFIDRRFQRKRPHLAKNSLQPKQNRDTHELSCYDTFNDLDYELLPQPSYAPDLAPMIISCFQT